MTPIHRLKATLAEDGKLSLSELPFRAGQVVEVIVMPVPQPVSAMRSLRGAILRYALPTEPVAEADWDALR